MSAIIHIQFWMASIAGSHLPGSLSSYTVYITTYMYISLANKIVVVVVLGGW